MHSSKISAVLFAAAALTLSACTDKGGDTGGSDDGGATTGGTTTGGTTTGGTTTWPTTTHGYTSYDGWESFDYAYAPKGVYNCQYVWWATGTAVSPNYCVGCDFVFDVSLEFDEWEFSDDDGTCHGMGVDMNMSYAYTSDYYGYGPMALTYYNGYYYAFAYGSFSGSDFTYWLGVKDYPYDYGGAYPGYYYTYYWYGTATVQ